MGKFKKKMVDSMVRNILRATLETCVGNQGHFLGKKREGSRPGLKHVRR